VLTELSCA